MNKKFISAVLLGMQLTILTGCGTLDRNSNYHSTYKGTHQDIKMINESYLWLLSLGIVPAFAIMSLPIDIAVDTLLYPFEKEPSINSSKEYELEKMIPVYSLNWSEQKDFPYTLIVDDRATPLITSTALKIQQNNISPIKINLDQLLPNRHGSTYNITKLTFTKRQQDPKQNNGLFMKSEQKIEKATTARQINNQTRSIVIIFLPCNEVTVLGSTQKKFDISALQYSAAQADYIKLKQQAEQSKCPPITPDMVVNLI